MITMRCFAATIYPHTPFAQSRQRTIPPPTFPVPASPSPVPSSPMSDLTLTPITRPFRVTMSPPGSKSLTNRALVIAALSDGVTELSNVLFADDTLVMLECLQRLGFHLE